MSKVIQINPGDTVAVVLSPLKKGEVIALGAETVTLVQDIQQGHKFALSFMNESDSVIKYGFPIGHATKGIAPGEWVHVHNLATNLSEQMEYTYAPAIQKIEASPPETFMGYLRKDGKVGVRNEIWIIPTVGCVNDIAERLAQMSEPFEGVDNVCAFPHPYGCSQMGEDHENTKKLLAALVRHPNAGGVLVVGLGCENNTMASFQAEIGQVDNKRVKFMICQDEVDEMESGIKLINELAEYAGKFKRQPLPVSELVIGMKCGGSDGLSGITANPVVGAFSDLMISKGGSMVLTEVPEMFGAETILMNRAVNEKIFEKTMKMVNDFKSYFIANKQTVYENPSPGNKQGGISTLEDKSLGCVQKGGKSPVSDVIEYAGHVKTKGLTLLYGPGNDLVSATALAAAGAHMILFTTGRGTPFGAPGPTIKISSNAPLFQKKKNWLDFDAGPVAEGEEITSAAKRLMNLVLETASGKIQTKAEQQGYRGIAIFKSGITL